MIMNKEEMLKRLKDIHLLYSMPMMAQNMRPEHYAIVEYEKLAYEQQAIITQLTNNWNELEEWLDKVVKITANIDEKIICKNVLDKMNEIKERKNENI